MADEQHEIRHIRWNEVFSFTQIFKGFRLAIHPSKLILGLMAIIIIFAGGWAMDAAWSITKTSVMENEIAVYTQLPQAEFREGVKRWEDSRLDNAAALWRTWENEKASLLRFSRLFSGPLRSAFDDVAKDAGKGRAGELNAGDKKWDELLGDAKQAAGDARKDAKDLLKKAEKNARKAVEDSNLTGNELDEALAEIEKNVLLARQGLTRLAAEFDERALSIRGRPIFASLMDFEADHVHGALVAARQGNILGGLGGNSDKPGFLRHILTGLHGICWLMCTHLVFAIIFLIFSLAVWALFGGAIYRIAALHAARDEKISISQALRFSAGKFFSFFMAPIVPITVIAIIGVGVLASALLANLAFGSIIVGLLFFLAILGGLAITFLLFGLVGGGSLMYPTIAVEGSDSFDAISRSYSYIFNRPWRAALYSLVAIIYGSLCYLFIRTFAYVSLKATHVAVKTGVGWGGEAMEGATDRIDIMWSSPTFDNLAGEINTAAASGPELVGAWMISLWVHLIIGLVIAFLITYFCSATTLIYYLLRRQVDATDLDEVYVAEPHEEQIEAVSAEAESTGDDAPADDEKAE